MRVIRSIFLWFKACLPSGLLLVASLTLTSCDQGAYKRGYSEGLDDGFQQGRSSGLAEGYASGLEEGFANGFRDGSAEGHKAGKKEGYLKGQKAFIGEHWLPSAGLGICGGLGLLVGYGTILLCRHPFRWCGSVLMMVANSTRNRLLARSEMRGYFRKLKKQETELAAILKVRAEFVCALNLRKLGLDASEENIQTKVQQFIHESVILPELAQSMNASLDSLRDVGTEVSDTDGISATEKRHLWQEFVTAIDLDEGNATTGTFDPQNAEHAA